MDVAGKHREKQATASVVGVALPARGTVEIADPAEAMAPAGAVRAPMAVRTGGVVTADRGAAEAALEEVAVAVAVEAATESTGASIGILNVSYVETDLIASSL